MGEASPVTAGRAQDECPLPEFHPCDVPPPDIFAETGPVHEGFPKHPAGFIDKADLREHRHELGIAFEMCCDLGHPVGCRNIVGCHTDDNIAAGGRYGPVPTGRDACVRLRRQEPGQRPPRMITDRLLDDFAGAIRGAVIHDDDFDSWVCLVESRDQGLPNKRGVLITQEDDGSIKHGQRFFGSR